MPSPKATTGSTAISHIRSTLEPGKKIQTIILKQYEQAMAEAEAEEAAAEVLSKKEERMPPGGKRKWLRFPPGGVFVSKNKDDDIQKYIAIFL